MRNSLANVRLMTLLTNARAWVRATPAWPEADQEAAVREWCAERGVRVVVYRESEIGREAWITALRNTEAAVLPRLDLIVARKLPPRGRPKDDLTVTLSRVQSRCSIVVDVDSGATTEHEKRWQAALAKALARVSAGRRTIKPKKARDMARRSAEIRMARSVVRQWTDDNPTARKKLATYSAVWKSRKFRNWEEARDALPDDLHGMSRRTLERIFGGRTK